MLQPLTETMPLVSSKVTPKPEAGLFPVTYEETDKEKSSREEIEHQYRKKESHGGAW